MSYQKIPDHAECVFKGVIFDVYHFQKEFYDGSIRTIEILKRPDTVVVIPMDEEEIYYCHQSQPHRPEPFLSLVSGRVEPGEAPLDAAKRELKEETGLASDDWELLQATGVTSKIDWTVHLYVARGVKKIGDQELDGGEKIEVRHIPIDRFFQEIIPDPQFKETELKEIIYSRFNAEAAEALKAKLLARN